MGSALLQFRRALENMGIMGNVGTRRSHVDGPANSVVASVADMFGHKSGDLHSVSLLFLDGVQPSAPVLYNNDSFLLGSLSEII